MLLAVFTVYWPALAGQFLWDDMLVVHRNPLVTGEMSPRAIWFHMDFPLTYVAFWLEWLAWGNHPAGYHIVNVLLHAASALLLWRVLARLRIPAPWLAAMLFAVHPLCVGSVAWISELKNTLSLPFFLLSLLLYLQSDSNLRTSDFGFRNSLRISDFGFRISTSYCLSLLAFVLALLSKTSTVMLPMVLMACVWWQRGRITWRDGLRTSPYFAIALAFGLMTIWFQAHGAISGATVQTENFWGRLAGAGMALWFYLGKALLPLHLSMIYPRWKIEAASGWSYLPLLLWCAVLAVCLGFSRVSSTGARAKEPQRRDERGEESAGEGDQTNHLSGTESQATETSLALRPSRLCGLIRHSSTPMLRLIVNLGRHLLFGLGCFTVTLFPVLGFFDMYFLMLSRVSDHFVYLPLTALAALAAAGLAWGLNRFFPIEETTKYTKYTKDQSHGLCSPVPDRFSIDAHNQKLGIKAPPPPSFRVFRVFRGLTELLGPSGGVLGAAVGGGLVVGLAVLSMLRAQVFVNEEALWRDTLTRNPNAWLAHANLGWILAKEQNYDEARAHLLASLELNPTNAQAHSNLGRLLSLQGKPAEAEAQFQAALKIKPKDAEIRRSYAAALAEQGRQEDAVTQFREALRLRPDTETRLQLATLFVQSGKPREAVAEYCEVLVSRPDLPEALNNVAWLLATCADATVRNGAEAVRLAERAYRLSGNAQPRELGTLAAAYAEAGRFPEAVAAAQKAVDAARAGGNDQLAAMSEQLLNLILAGKPYHMPPPE